MHSAHVHAFNETNFASEVLQQHNMPVLVSFTGAWARDGEALTPIVETIAQDFADQIKVGQVDFDTSYPLAGKYGVRSAPAVVLFQGGRMVGHHIGLTTREELVELLRVHQAPAGEVKPGALQ